MIFLREKWAIPTNKKASRILNWEGILSSKICYTEVSKFFNDNNRLGIVKQTLEPSTREKDKAYWNSVKDFRPSIPHWVHSVSTLFNEVIILLLNLGLLQVI